MKKVIQPRLFNWDVAQTGIVELFPAVWSAAEAITSPDIDLRLEGLARLEEMNAANYSPLVAYIVASRLVDPDLKMRAHVIRLLGDVIQSNLADPEIDQQVHQHINAYLGQMQTRQIRWVRSGTMTLSGLHGSAEKRNRERGGACQADSAINRRY